MQDTIWGYYIDGLANPAVQQGAADGGFVGDFSLAWVGLFAANQEPHTARPLLQRIDTRCLVHTPPDTPLTSAELDAVHAWPFMLDAHPIHAPKGKVRALETIRFSLATHRGCYGECNFCSIAVHQGRQVVSRSERSILEEARRLTHHPAFTGIIQDVGGPTANMYGFECERKTKQGACASKRCLFPTCCPALKPDHSAQISLLRRLRRLPGRLPRGLHRPHAGGPVLAADEDALH